MVLVVKFQGSLLKTRGGYIFSSSLSPTRHVAPGGQKSEIAKAEHPRRLCRPLAARRPRHCRGQAAGVPDEEPSSAQRTGPPVAGYLTASIIREGSLSPWEIAATKVGL